MKLEAGDRLEPSPNLQDVAEFDNITRSMLPILLCFWRASKEAKVNHRNPILCEELGTDITNFRIDTLHTLHLGVGGEAPCKVFVITGHLGTRVAMWWIL